VPVLCDTRLAESDDGPANLERGQEERGASEGQRSVLMKQAIHEIGEVVHLGFCLQCHQRNLAKYVGSVVCALQGVSVFALP